MDPLDYTETLAHISAELHHYPALGGCTVLDIYLALPEADERWSDGAGGLDAMLAELDTEFEIR